MQESLYVKSLPPHDRQVEQLEYEVYSDAGYIAPNSERRVLENANYPDHDVAAVFSGDLIVGSVRLAIDPSPRSSLFSLHCFDPFVIRPWAQTLLRETPPHRLLQVGTMVIREGYRGGAAFHLLFQSMLEKSLQARIRYAVASIDERFFLRLKSRNVPFVAMGETLEYMGSRTVPALVGREWVTRGQAPAHILALSRGDAAAAAEQSANAHSA